MLPYGWSRISFILTATLGLALVATAARAQSDDESNGAVQFNFSTPGARSLALGGTFLGSANDATAAYTNPAGLLQLSEPEVSLEARRWDYSTPFAERGRTSGSPTGIGADTFSDIRFGRAEAELEGISFASFVYPSKDWSFAVYYHQVAQFESEFETRLIFAEDGANTSRLRPVMSSYDLDISQIGLAYAHQWGNVAAGIGVSFYSMELSSITQRFSPMSFFGPVDFAIDPKVNFQTQTGDSDELGFNVGLHWDLNPRVTVGAVYRVGPEFDINIRSLDGSPENPIPGGIDAASIFDLPDVAGLGFSYRPSQALTVNFDLVQVLYSQLTEEDSFFVIFDEGGLDADNFVIDDATEIRLGLEYVFINRAAPVAVRVGTWWDPDHRLRVEGGSELNQARLFEGDDEIHFSAGIGLTITSQFQLDAAADFSDNADTVSLSLAYRF